MNPSRRVRRSVLPGELPVKLSERVADAPQTITDPSAEMTWSYWQCRAGGRAAVTFPCVLTTSFGAHVFGECGPPALSVRHFKMARLPDGLGGDRFPRSTARRLAASRSPPDAEEPSSH